MTDTRRIPPSIKSYSRASTAEMLCVSERQLDRLIKSGDLNAYTIGSRGIRVTEDSIRLLIESRQIPAPETELVRSPREDLTEEVAT